MNIKKCFSDRTWGFWLGLASGAISLICAFVYLGYTVSVGLFVGGIFVFLLLGAFASALYFTKYKFVTVLPVLLVSVALGWHIFDRMEMFFYMATGVYGMGETGAVIELVILIFAMMLVSLILACAANFTKFKKNA